MELSVSHNLSIAFKVQFFCRKLKSNLGGQGHLFPMKKES